MAHFALARPSLSAPALGGLGAQLCRALIAPVVRHYQRRRLRDSLERLDDRMLRDIGIERSRIRDVVQDFRFVRS